MVDGHVQLGFSIKRGVVDPEKGLETPLLVNTFAPCRFFFFTPLFLEDFVDNAMRCSALQTNALQIVNGTFSYVFDVLSP